MNTFPLFPGFFMGGFECATQIMPSGERVDLLAATGHDQHVVADYARMRSFGLTVAREGLRWHLIERTPGAYDFSSVLPMVRAARQADIRIVWDICHYGWPDDLDVFSAAFVDRCAGLAQAFARLLADETDQVPFFVPINEISFFSWVGGEVGHFHPFAVGHGYALKQQLVRASLAAIEAIWQVNPHTRIVFTEPLIHVAAEPARMEDHATAESYRLAQYQALDMLAGYLEPQLGGQPKYLDLIGVNYYPHNQWLHNGLTGIGTTISRHDPLYRPFRHMLAEIHQRYQRPLFVAETSSLGALEIDWWRYVCGEVRSAMVAGVPVEGLCLYPLIDTPDWNDATSWHQGLWSRADGAGQRQLLRPLARELQRQQLLFGALAQVGSQNTELPTIFSDRSSR